MSDIKKEYDKTKAKEAMRRIQKTLDGVKTAIYISEEQARNEMKKNGQNGKE